jgi:hypothetical protein
VRTESKKISANRNQRGRSKKTNQKKRTNVADTRKIEGKKMRAMRKKGRKKMRERERREGYSHISVSIQILLYPPHPSAREGTRQKRDALVHLIAHNGQSKYHFLIHKAPPGFFLCIFSSLYLPVETCFQQVGSFAVEGTSQAVLGSADQRKVPASLSLFLKSEKIPALLYLEKGPPLQALL